MDATEAIGGLLERAGVRRVFGDRLGGLPCVPVADRRLGELLAAADGRVNRMGACRTGRELLLTSAPGLDPRTAPIRSAADLVPLLAGPSPLDVPGAIRVDLDIDLDEPAAMAEDAAPQRWLRRVRLSPDLGGDRVAVLAGPGVVRSGAVDQLQAFAATTGWGVVNTWGAKGVFRWDSPFHLGTAGLQARDFELAGIIEAHFVVAVGVDPAEAPPDRLAGPEIIDLHPLDLASAVAGWTEPAGEPERPPLYTELSAVVMPLYDDDRTPRNPARAARELGADLPPGGLVAADPGPAGFWVARTFPTVDPGSVLVPATSADGFAAAAALVAGLDGRPSVAVTTGPVDATTTELLDLARQLEVEVDLHVWGDGGEEVDFGALAALEEVAGPVVAWTA